MTAFWWIVSLLALSAAGIAGFWAGLAVGRASGYADGHADATRSRHLHRAVWWDYQAEAGEGW